MSNKAITYSIFFLILFKITAINFTNFNLYGDEAQYWLWSKQIDFGYYSKPPLLAWFLGLYTKMFGDSFEILKLFPIIVYFFISFSVYILCLSLSLTKRSSLLCSTSFLVIPAASLSSFIISTDLLLLLFWIVSLVLLLKTIKTKSTTSFALLGFFLGLAFLAKYAAVYFLICLLLLLTTNNKTFVSFKENIVGCMFFLITFFLVLMPNIFWNINNDWLTLTHTSDNANLKNLNLNFVEPLKFVGSQAFMLGPFMVIFFVFFLKHFRLDFENYFLLIFSLPVFFIVLMESFLVRANANWAAPALISLFILMFRLINNHKPNLIKINFFINYFMAIALFGSVLISLDNSLFDRIRGIENFSKEISAITKDKDLVVSDRIIFSNISYEMRGEKRFVFMPYKSGSPITNHFQISSPLKKDRSEVFFLIGGLDDILYLSKKHKSKLIKEYDVSFSSSQIKLYEISFN